MKVAIKLSFSRETKNYKLYAEVEEPFLFLNGQVYLAKAQVPEGNPDITISVSDELEG